MTLILDRLRTVNWRDHVVYFAFALVFVYFAITQSDYFLTTSNLTNVIIQAAPITVMAVGTVFVLATGEIDLSIGSTVAVAALVTAKVLESTEAWPLAALAGLATGLVIGLVNGLFVTVVRLPSFLVTLATMGLLVGVARQLTDLKSVPVLDDSFVWLFGGGKILGISIMVWWTLLVVLLGWHLLRQRRFGAHVLAVGNSPAAAQVTGIKVNRVRLKVFMISGATAALAGILYSGRLQGARYTLGESDMMSVLAAVIVGGTALAGGKGAVVGALAGSLLMAMINNGLILAGLNVSQQMIVRGVIILIAVSLSLRAKKSN
ncbi:MAG: inner-rane translocator [Aeromicrobium sp.]|jgi:ribose transport system permease protein|nr:inner-rane translocator [Aeromicrobium sp.]